MPKPIKTRTVVFREDTFLQKLNAIRSSLMLHPSEVVRGIKVLNNSVVLEVAPKEK